MITDSTAGLLPQEYEKLGIICIPLRIAFGDREYQENIELNSDQTDTLRRVRFRGVWLD